MSWHRETNERTPRQCRVHSSTILISVRDWISVRNAVFSSIHGIQCVPHVKRHWTKFSILMRVFHLATIKVFLYVNKRFKNWRYSMTIIGRLKLQLLKLLFCEFCSKFIKDLSRCCPKYKNLCNLNLQHCQSWIIFKMIWNC